MDLIIRKSRPFSREEFSRRRQADYFGSLHWFASAEDVILAKLEWARAGESERQFTDALNIARIQGSALDIGYLTRWASELGVEHLLSRLLKEAKEPA